MAFMHGAYGSIQTASASAAKDCKNAIVYIGTAPVQNIEGGAGKVNVPIVVRDIAEARAKLGYSEDWDKYTLCEAMHAHLENNHVGPLVLINVLDPTEHTQSTGGSATKTPVNGKIVLTGAQEIYMDSIVVTTTDEEDPVTKVKGVDYSVAYDWKKQTITIAEITAGSLGTDALSITWSIIDPTAVDDADVIGSTDELGTNTGIYAIRNVYQMTGYIPSFMLAPGFSSSKSVHDAMIANSTKVNGHWDVYVLADLPLSASSTPLTLNTVVTWKNANGYDKPNESVYFPMASGTDGHIYHISVLAAANFQSLLVTNEGLPYMTASNTECPIIENLYMGSDNTGKVYDDTLINEKLNKNGINSAAYASGAWRIWGRFSANYNQSDADMLNIAETNTMMLFYISNDFQMRRTKNVDRVVTANTLKSIVAEEQANLDALIKIGALTYGVCEINAEAISKSDVFSGDYYFAFNVTTTPLAKSLTAMVNWSEDGFTTFFDSLGI